MKADLFTICAHYSTETGRETQFQEQAECKCVTLNLLMFLGHNL